MVIMNAPFYRAQAALCLRLSESLPQEHIARELIQLATEYERKAREIEDQFQAAEAEPSLAPTP